MVNCTLGEILDLNYGKGLTESKRQGGEINVYGSGGIIGKHNVSFVNGPGIIVGRKGNVGSIFYEKGNFFPIDTVYYVTLKNEFDDIRYFYYLLKTLRLNQLNSDAAVPGLNRDAAYRVKIKIHDKNKQSKISFILGNYDDLIENNLRRIELLEKSADLIYKEWFVNLRYPGYENAEIKNDIPKGWEKKKISSFANVLMGQSPSSKFYNENNDGLPFHQGVKDFGSRFVNNNIYSSALLRIANSGDILFSVRAPVGRINITLDKIVIGRGLAAIRSKFNYQSFLFYQLKNHFFKEDMIGAGAIYASVGKDELNGQEILTPTDKLIKQFQEIVIPIDDQIENLTKQNRILSKARDLLLPKLINGEIEV